MCNCIDRNTSLYDSPANSYFPNRLYHKTMNFSTERKKAPPTTVLAGVCVTGIFDGTNQGEALYIIRNVLRYIINTKCCISSSRRQCSLRLMICACGDDIHADAWWYTKPAAWIKKEVTFGRQKLLLFWRKERDSNPRVLSHKLISSQVSKNELGGI